MTMNAHAITLPGIAPTNIRRLRTLLASPLIRNLGSMGSAQIAMRVSRLLATIVLARLLSPLDFGMAAVVLTVYEFVALFTRNGITAKVVQASETEVRGVAETAYWLTWIACGALLVLQLLIALPIAWVYHDARLALPIALMGLIYLATPLSNIQCAFMQREGRVGRIAFAGGLQVTTDNILTAIFAVLGMGMWAIVLPKLLVAPIWVVINRTGHAWRPASTWKPMLAGWQDIARFSRSVIGVELLTTIQANVDNLLVGYFLGIEALGIYYFAFNAGVGITLGLVNAFGVAVYPYLCQVRSDRAQLTARYRAALRTLGCIVVPLVLLQVLLAPIYVPIVFGQHWVSAVPVLMVICLSVLPRPFASTCSQLLKAVGRPDIELRWQLVLTAVLVAGLVLGAQIGILGMAIAVLTVQIVVLTAYCLRAPHSFIGKMPTQGSPL
jgi:teichuronic acid exporter